MTIYKVDEPPIGFAVSYYGPHGLHVAPMQLAIHDSADPEVIKRRLYVAYTALCNNLQPLRPVSTPTPAPLNRGNMPLNRGMRRMTASILKQHGEKIRQPVVDDSHGPPPPLEDT